MRVGSCQVTVLPGAMPRPASPAAVRSASVTSPPNVTRRPAVSSSITRSPDSSARRRTSSQIVGASSSSDVIGRPSHRYVLGAACEAEPMEPWELTVREHVRDLIAHYNLAGDRGWIDDMLTLFTADATLSIDGIDHVGHDAIRSVFANAAGPHPELIRHHVATLKIDVPSPEHASSRCYFQVLTAYGLDHWGRYSDRFS